MKKIKPSEELQTDRRRLTVEDLQLIGLPESTWSVSPKQLKGSHSAVVLKALRNLDKLIEDGAGIVFWSDEGVRSGKTSCAAMIALEARRRGADVRFIYWPEICDVPRWESSSLNSTIRTVDVLVVDDYLSTGKRNCLELAEKIIKMRHEHNKMTVITMAFRPKSLEELSPSLASLIKDSYFYLEFKEPVSSGKHSRVMSLLL